MKWRKPALDSVSRSTAGDDTDTTPEFRGHAGPGSAGEPIVPQREKNGYRVRFDPGGSPKIPQFVQMVYAFCS